MNQPQPLHSPFLSSYARAPLASSPSTIGSEWCSGQKRQESQRTSGSSPRFLASSSFSPSSSFRLSSFCDGVRIMFCWKGWVTTHLKFFFMFPCLLLFLLTFEFPSSLFLPRWSQNGILSEEIKATTHFVFFLASPSFFLFLLMIEFPSPLFPLQYG